MTRRKNIRAILSNPTLRVGLIEGATDFICKVEGIRSPSFSTMLITNFTATGRDLYTLYEGGRNVQAWTELYHIPQELIPLATASRRIAVTAEQYNKLASELVK